jgi:hypothetical protein
MAIDIANPGADEAALKAALRGLTSYERPHVLPRIADFTLLNPGTASMVDTETGIRLNTPSAVSNMRYAASDGALGATWEVIAKIRALNARTDTTQFQRGLAVKNTNGRLLTLHDRAGSGIVTVDRWGNYTSPGGGSGLGNLSTANLYEMPWRKISFDGATYSFACSPTGFDDEFYTFYTEASATYFTAVGGAVESVGFFNWTDSGPYPIADLIQSFEIN